VSQLKEAGLLKTLMEENNRPLKELSHRVGNNLAIVMSALRTELKNAPPDQRDALERTLQRVFELAAEHEQRMHRSGTGS
jgi:two-component sensor histidine kinase